MSTFLKKVGEIILSLTLSYLAGWLWERYFRPRLVEEEPGFAWGEAP